MDWSSLSMDGCGMGRRKQEGCNGTNHDISRRNGKELDFKLGP